MPIETKTITTFKCDRCGFTSMDETARGGCSIVKISFTSRAYDDTPGGANLPPQWLCGNCTALLRDFFHPRKDDK